jgi:hypothetical protein
VGGAVWLLVGYLAFRFVVVGLLFEPLYRDTPFVSWDGLWTVLLAPLVFLWVALLVLHKADSMMADQWAHPGSRLGHDLRTSAYIPPADTPHPHSATIPPSGEQG